MVQGGEGTPLCRERHLCFAVGKRQLRSNLGKAGAIEIVGHDGRGRRLDESRIEIGAFDRAKRRQASAFDSERAGEDRRARRRQSGLDLIELAFLFRFQPFEHRLKHRHSEHDASNWKETMTAGGYPGLIT
ncbi:hypothetical protein D9M72_422320 [compost metagenome]